MQQSLQLAQGHTIRAGHGRIRIVWSPCTRGDFTHCNFHRWYFSFHQQVQIPDLHLGNLHCVVVVFGGGGRHICGGCSYGVVVVGKCIGVIQRLASNRETQTSSKESGHSIATS